jgi:dTDP-4-dehydrorhamnose reductase
MTNALLGYTGFVGTTLRGQTHFDALYNSQNIAAIRGNQYDLIICAAAPAAKWKANQDPVGDQANLSSLMDHLRHVRAKRFIHISTVDVFKMPPAAYEDSPVTPERLDTYGRNRYALEESVREHFPQAIIVRLPGLFGAGLRKNFLFDMIHRGSSEWTHADSVFQFYNMAHLWQDLQIILHIDPPLSLIHFACEPVKASDIAYHVFDVKYEYQTASSPVAYDLRTRYAHLWGRNGDYIASANETYAQIQEYIEIK